MTHREDLLAVRIPAEVRLSEAEFFALAQANPSLQFERKANGDVLIMPPTGGTTGSRSLEIAAELRNWNQRARLGRTFDSSTGFALPDGSIASPDAAWVALSRWEALTPDQQRRFPPLCPDFVAELCSPSDRLDAVKDKMEWWLSQGCRLGWLLDPERERALVYRPGQPVAEFAGFDQSLSGDPELPGFALDLSLLRA